MPHQVLEEDNPHQYFGMIEGYDLRKTSVITFGTYPSSWLRQTEELMQIVISS